MFSKELSVIVVNYKSEKYLKGCLTSIYAKIPKDLNFEIIVANNEDKFLNLSELQYKEIKIINRQKNDGYGAGVNAGARIAEGEIMLFLNPDSEIVSENIKEVLDYIHKNKNIAALGSRIISADGKVQDWIAGKEISFFNLLRNNLRLAISRKIWMKNEAIEADWVAGTAMFVRKDLFTAVSGFDERFFMYFEDMDLCKRLNEAGGQILYFPRFEVMHSGGGSYADRNKQKKDYYKSQELYFKKHKNALEASLVKILGKLFFR